MNFGVADVLTLLGSLGLFLFGMKFMSDRLMDLAGHRLRNILASLTSNRFLAVLTGFMITAIIQSSSATTVMVVSFVNASLLSLSEAIGVILGAHIGTTVTAWLIALLGFKVSLSAISLPLVALGISLGFLKSAKAKAFGGFIIGFALLFLGLEFMKETLPDINEHPAMLAKLQAFTGHGYLSLLFFLLVGTLLTLVMQSSSATMGLTLMMCHEGWIPIEPAAAMILGENIGTTVTANLSATVANYEGKRAARAHMLTNVFGVIWMMAVLLPYLNLLDRILYGETERSIFSDPGAAPVVLSIFHTSFNVLNTLVLVGFIPLIARMVSRMVRKVEEKPAADEVPKYLTASSMNNPHTALEAVTLEAKRLMEGPVTEIIAHALNLHRIDVFSGEKLGEVIRRSNTVMDINVQEMYYKRVKRIYSEILKYAAETQSTFTLPEEQSTRLTQLKRSCRLMYEVINELGEIRNNLNRYTLSTNPYIQHEYNRLRKKVSKILRLMDLIIREGDSEEKTDKLKSLRIKAKVKDVLVDGTLDNLIRSNQITTEMASSLANDSAHIAEICDKLVEVILLLYARADLSVPKASEETQQIAEKNMQDTED